MALLAFVTGAAGGIGNAVATRLAKDGFRVAASDLDAERAEQLAATLPGAGHVGLALDVSDENAVVDGLARVEREIAPVNVMVAAAGLLILDENGQRRPIIETAVDEWERTQRVNSTGTFLLIREYLRHRASAPLPHARFIAFSSVAAQLGGYRSSSAYIASKSAVLGLVKAAAREAAPIGVTVNAVAPGLIDAPMLRLSLDPSNDSEIARSIPLNRIGTPDDVAGAVAFLAGPDSAYLTGATIDINGGYRMQ
ncbi:SDR family oxidoreductase [Nitratireductor sp. L1-7-SE]|uniref:SDR family oxidoreductase n=1 Tax=Nitratireductor rhodophyticola TaxID=2854036 RepID=A0ABS7R8Q1_9HYPH|nr:SDR family NAD(P)-dependent oxidoreductase [Nitratireductor rhodophyticola]MBY8916356.1 SDR family oxidoreductase [Nitratireductor rhodophyticola]MBY8921719.1 SDR family oxidoreductase [Nitratireductor rhodophyticola]